VTFKLNTNLSPEQAAFAVFLEERAPQLVRFWNWDARCIQYSDIDVFLRTASHGEALLLTFFVGVWEHRNHYDFDVFEAFQTLDEESLSILRAWFNRPIWP
jgi:hypothetical protein